MANGVLRQIADAMATALESTALQSGAGSWARVKGEELPENAPEADRDMRFYVAVDQRRVVLDDFGVAAKVWLSAPVSVRLFREIEGDAEDALQTLRDDALAAANKIEKYSSYPAGTDAVLFVSDDDVEPLEPTFREIRLNFIVRYQDTY